MQLLLCLTWQSAQHCVKSPQGHTHDRSPKSQHELSGQPHDEQVSVIPQRWAHCYVENFMHTIIKHNNIFTSLVGHIESRQAVQLGTVQLHVSPSCWRHPSHRSPHSAQQLISAQHTNSTPRLYYYTTPTSCMNITAWSSNWLAHL